MAEDNTKPEVVEPIVVSDEELDGDHKLVFEEKQDTGPEDAKEEGEE